MFINNTGQSQRNPTEIQEVDMYQYGVGSKVVKFKGKRSSLKKNIEPA